MIADMDERTIRLRCLELAEHSMGDNEPNGSADIILRAKSFEAFVLGRS